MNDSTKYWFKYSPSHGNVTKVFHICIEESYNIQNELWQNYNHDKDRQK